MPGTNLMTTEQKEPRDAETITIILAAFTVSTLLGIPLALAISFSPVFRRIVYPIIVFSQVIPKIAIAPLFVIWFGFGFLPKLLIAILVSFFAVMIIPDDVRRGFGDVGDVAAAGGGRGGRGGAAAEALPHPPSAGRAKQALRG